VDAPPPQPACQATIASKPDTHASFFNIELIVFLCGGSGGQVTVVIALKLQSSEFRKNKGGSDAMALKWD
jgi:hypothetical protein